MLPDEKIPFKTTVYRIWKKENLLPIRKNKKIKKRNLSEIKKKYQPFEKIQIDTKELKNIPNYMQQCYKYQKFPRYQYTARDIKTGATFIALAYEKTSTNSTIFSQLVFNHLEKFNIN